MHVPPRTGGLARLWFGSLNFTGPGAGVALVTFAEEERATVAGDRSEDPGTLPVHLEAKRIDVVFDAGR